MSENQIKEFEKLFKINFKPLCLFALRFINSAEDAEDIVQQAFSDTWEKLQTGKEIPEKRSYLYSAVKNRCINSQKQYYLNIPLDELDELKDVTEQEQILQAERDSKLWTLIDELPPKRKMIFLYAKKDGLKYAEIAEELGISIKTVENQMNKAMKNLKEKIINIYLFLFY